MAPPPEARLAALRSKTAGPIARDVRGDVRSAVSRTGPGDVGSDVFRTGSDVVLSAVVCTRNRAAPLERCLRHLEEACSVHGPGVQVIVVDNGSDDDTADIVARRAARMPVTYVFEGRRGLSHARNRGIAEARGSIIAFTDDDCIVAPDWARTIVAEFGDRPGVSVLGGRVELADDGDYPVSVRRHPAAEHVTTAAQILSWMSGCNMAFRREVFARAGLFDPAFGKGRRIGAAEDIDLLYRVRKQDGAMMYLPNIVVRHAHGRDSDAALASVNRDYVVGRGAFYCKYIADRQIAKMAYWEISALVKQWLRGTASSKALRSLAAGALYQSLNGMRGGARRANRHIG